jgi:hypothetical protein
MSVAERQGERGQNLIEFALLAPFVLIFIGAIVIFGLAMNARASVQHAVREGARAASTGATLQQVKNAATLQADEWLDAPDVYWCHPDSPDRGKVGSQVVVYLDREGDDDPGGQLGIPFTLVATGGILGIFGADDLTVQLSPKATARLEKSVPVGSLEDCPEGIPQ